MLCTFFSTYLETKPMRLADLNRSARRARKAFAVSTAHYAAAETEKAQKRAERRTNAARKRMVQAQRAADQWADYALD